MKKILIAFLFILTAIPAAFSASADYFVKCNKTNDTYSLSKLTCSDANKNITDTHRLIKGIIVENCSQIQLKRPDKCPGLRNFNITFVPNDTSLPSQTIKVDGPVFVFYISKNTTGRIFFQKTDYKTAVADSNNVNDSGSYIPLTPDTRNLTDLYITAQNGILLPNARITIGNLTYTSDAKNNGWFINFNRTNNDAYALVSCDGYEARVIPVSQLQGNIKLTKTTTPLISIRVTDPSGKGLSGANVNVDGTIYTSINDGWVPNIKASADTRGTISHPDFDAGTKSLKNNTTYTLSKKASRTSTGSGTGGEKPSGGTNQADKITAEGHVYDNETKQPLSGVTIYVPERTELGGVTTDDNGHFSFSFDKSGGQQIIFDIIGYNSATRSVGTNMSVYLVPENIKLEETKVTEKDICSNSNEQKKQELNAKTIKWYRTDEDMDDSSVSITYEEGGHSTAKKSVCIPETCKDDYILKYENSQDAVCTPCDQIPFADTIKIENGKCVPKKCKNKFTRVDDKCVVDCNDDAVLKALNATKAELKSGEKTPNGTNINYSDYCKATVCDESKYDLIDNICVSKEGKDCDPKIENANGGKYVKTKNGDILCEPNCNGENYRAKLDGGKYSCVLKSDRENDNCTKDELARMNVPHAKHGMVKEWDKNTGEVKSCTIDACDDGWLPNATGDGCDEICTPEITNKLKADGAFDVRVSDDGKTCVAKSCKCEYTLTDDGECVPWAESKHTECKPKQDGATGGTPHCDGGKEVCYITTCDEPKYTLEGTAGTANAKCVSNVGKDCNDVVALPENATAGKQREIDGQMKCVATACKTGYDLRPDGSACVPKMVLSVEDYQQEIADLSKNADAMHEKENSWENRLIGAAGIGLTGVGGMMVGSALSEQTADAETEAKMRQYLETFRCDYGDGKLIHGGEVNVELPGGNDMIELYTEYATRAADLKARKEALGMRPGIESEIVIDKAETGLYEYSPDGITGGTYASIARALMDPDGEDAAMWAAQKEATANKLKAGAIVAGVGSVGSLAANIAVNHNNPNKVKEIVAKYDRMRIPFDNLQRRNDSRPLPTCSDIDINASGTLGNCVCYNKPTKYWFNAEETPACQECKGDLIVNQTRSGCECPNGMRPDAQNPTKCVKIDTNKCKLSDDIVLYNDGTCDCMLNATKNGTVCKCPYGSADGKCNPAPKPEEKPDTPPQTPEGSTIATVKLQADKYFTRGSYELNSGAKEDLQNFIKQAKEEAQKAVPPIDLKTSDDYCVIIVGKTDHQQFSAESQRKGKNNTWLSQERAKTIRTELEKAEFKNIKTYGIADRDCSSTSKGEVPECRVVEAKLIAGSCDANLQTQNIGNIIQDLATTADAVKELSNQIKQ